MTQDVIFYTMFGFAVIGGVLSLGLGVALYRADLRLRAARIELNRITGWGEYWRDHAAKLAIERTIAATRRSQAASKARQAQLCQQRTKVAERTAELQRGLAA
jgi:hypothetical protein